MFPWNIAKSAEAMFSRWAMKKVCKFLLKKKLGQFILGDIDLNQLDVQLSAGTIQLSDLALNVEYINEKFGAAAVNVKEGSIGSLLVTMPWKGKGCQIEVDELEIVLGPGGRTGSQVGSETCVSSLNGNYGTRDDVGATEHEKVDNGVINAAVDVHEGVKTIAKMVKWLLTSFHIKIKKLIVAFDPCIGDEKNKGVCRALVLRMAEVECGTGASEYANSDNDVRVDNILGLNRMTNFVKFQGAILEFLQVDNDDSQSSLPCDSGETFGDFFKGCCSSNATTPIITNGRSGFSGTIKLSIPWKNGSLDIRKVDADVYIDPLEIILQPSSIRCFLHLWDIFKDVHERSKGQMHEKEPDSVYYSAASNCNSSTHGSCVYANDKLLSNHGIFSSDSQAGKETVITTVLSGSHLISDWVRSSVTRNERDITESEPDFGDSIDQFFECFDELRTSQSALGNSGMWNWTCSVFSAITAASNLASGSLHIPVEQKHAETNLKATIAGISLIFSLADEEQKHTCDQTNASSDVHYIGANFESMIFILQVCPQEMNFNATVEHIELADYFSNEKDVTNVDLNGCSDELKSQITLIEDMQAAVEGALPLGSYTKDTNLAKPTKFVAADVPFGMPAMDRHSCATNCGSNYRNNIVKVTLLRTSGVGQCQLTVTFGSSNSSFSGPISFSLKLPPFVFWVNFHLISMLLDLLKELKNSLEMTSTSLREYGSSYQENVRKNSCPPVTKFSPEESLRGNIFLPNARIIFCFPYEKCGDFRNYTSWDQFIALDFSSPSSLREEKRSARTNVATSKKRHSSATSCSLHLNMGNLDIYFITSFSKDIVESNSSDIHRLKYVAQNIMSVSDLSVLSMIWQVGYMTGPWIAKRAKFLATVEDLSSREKLKGKGHDFASVTTVEDMEDLDTHTREEMIFSSGFFLHANISPVLVNLESSQYRSLHCLLQQVFDWLACIVSDPIDTKEESFASQTSILVECDSLEISVSLEADKSIKSSIQNELPGSWHGLKLKIQKFELLYVSNIGGVRDSNFFWLAHGEGKLWGSITGVPNEEFLLISCSDSIMGRGDGEGSNVLSSRLSGSDIVHLWDADNFLTCTSITIRCSTITAIGGRLDWVDTIFSFFSLPNTETEQVIDDHLRKGDSERDVAGGSSFVVNLVDVGLSYEPYSKSLGAVVVPDINSRSTNVTEEKDEIYVACLLAASSLKISNKTLADSIDREYKIGMQDLGLLLCQVSGLKNGEIPYSVEYLHNCGYIKVAQEAHVEALLRVNCENGHLWEVECSESHIFLDTCHDTTSGLIRLAAQLQQLFTPDLEESVVHLQNRWNSIQQAHLSDEARTYIANSSVSTSNVQTSSEDTKNIPGIVNLMDEICEDAFLLNGVWDGQSGFSESKHSASINDGRSAEVNFLSARGSESSSNRGSVAFSELENNLTSFPHKSSPDFIEGYFLSDLCPLSELYINNQPSHTILKSKSKGFKDQELQRGRSGWYGDVSVNILENHVSEANKETGPEQREVGKGPLHTKPEGDKNVKGRIILKNINVMWRLYAGSDWHNFLKNTQNHANFHGRDTTVFMELVLSGMDFQYDIFPDGEIFVSRLSLSIMDFCLNDNSKDAPWKLVLGYYQSKYHPRRSSSKALKLDLEAVRPRPTTPLEEYRLRIALLPMRLHLHQSQLDFLISFFGEKGASPDKLPSPSQDFGEYGMLPEKSSTFGGHNINEEALLPYFQKFDIWPVIVRVDYSPCHVDLAALRGGKYVELVNLVPWKGVELQLKHVQAVGVYGWNCICETIIGEWLEDISQNQIHKLLKGLPPIRSLVAVGSGAAKLVSLPVKNYRKDHRLLKGMQRGTIAFLRSISLEAIGLGVHLAAGAHEVLLQAEYILTSIPPSVPWPVESRVNSNVRSNQPKDARHGIQQAYESISDGLGKSASALVQTPLKRYQRGAGIGSALASAAQAAPAAAIAPASAAVRAMHCALLGVRNSLDLEHKKESLDKYLGTTQRQRFL